MVVLSGLCAAALDAAVIVLAFGVAHGFFFPAEGAIVPRLAATSSCRRRMLLCRGSTRLLKFVGPMPAGALIATFTRVAGFRASGWLVVDAATFVVSVVMLWAMRVDRVPRRTRWAVARRRAPVSFGVRRQGSAYMLGDPLLRTLLGRSLLRTSPSDSWPVVLQPRTPERGSRRVGLAHVGLAPVPRWSPPSAARCRSCRVGDSGTCSLASWRRRSASGWALLGVAHSLIAAMALVLLMGLAQGYRMVSFLWVQARMLAHMMGRMTSLIIFASVGLVPLSQLLAGAVARWSVTALFVGAAVLLGLVVARAWFVPSLWAMGVQMAARRQRSNRLALAEAARAWGVLSSSETWERAVNIGSPPRRLGAFLASPASTSGSVRGMATRTMPTKTKAVPIHWGRSEGLVEDQVGRERLHGDEGEADAEDVGRRQRPERTSRRS